MKSFKQFIAEASTYQKGWIHKSGKSIITRGMRPYHVETFTNNLSKFGIKKSDVLSILEKRYDKWDAPDPQQEAEDVFKSLQSGQTDIDHEIEYLAMKKGWCRVVLGDHSSIGGMNIKSIYDAAKVVDKKFQSVIFNITSQRAMELIKYTRGGNQTKDWNIADSHIWNEWIKKGGDPSRIGQGRSEIGRTMAQFR